MKTIEVEIPEDLLELLKHSRLGDRSVSQQIRFAMAIHLLQQGIISTGKAASIAGEPRATFELMLGEMGIPAVTYTLEDYRNDREASRKLRSKSH